MPRKPNRRWYKPHVAAFHERLLEMGHAEATAKYQCALVSALLNAAIVSSDKAGIQAKYNSYLLPLQQKRARAAWELYQSNKGVPVFELAPPPAPIPAAVARIVYELRGIGLNVVPKLRWCDLHVDDAVVELHNVPRRGATQATMGVGALRPLLPALRAWAFGGNPPQGDAPLIPIATGSMVPRPHDLLMRDAAKGASTSYAEIEDEIEDEATDEVPAPAQPVRPAATPEEAQAARTALKKVNATLPHEDFSSLNVGRITPDLALDPDGEPDTTTLRRPPRALPPAPPVLDAESGSAALPAIDNVRLFPAPPSVPGKRGPKPRGPHSLTYTRAQLRVLLTLFSETRIMGLTPEALPHLRASHFVRFPEDPPALGLTHVVNPTPSVGARHTHFRVNTALRPALVECMRAVIRTFYPVARNVPPNMLIMCPSAADNMTPITLADAKILLSLTLDDVPPGDG